MPSNESLDEILAILREWEKGSPQQSAKYSDHLYPQGIFIFFIAYLLIGFFLFINSLKGFEKIHQ